ncbi:Globin [Aphelenchoides fujianensis]|nr:Globin [Aphelenchoides fujianensis]
MSSFVAHFFRVIATPSKVGISPHAKKSSSAHGTPKTPRAHPSGSQSSRKTTADSTASTLKLQESSVSIPMGAVLHPTIDELPELRSFEKELILQSWSDDFNFLFDLGSAIYVYIFSKMPECRTLFPAVHAHGDAYRESREFRSLALKFVTTISFAVKNLFHMAELNAHLQQVGERHIQFYARGFRPEFWSIFLDAMEYALTDRLAQTIKDDEEKRQQTVQAWRHLSLHMITHMRNGYYEALQRQQDTKL